ncbi:MFS transporter [Tsukamurella sp. 8F]|uniref:MFS transporter n=1 Tax=unclassified Tsukamurella TaxID=2633480 RepID=UPI0023BA2BB3|nr:MULTISPECIES: MFS transporter [unclassified Tsukamurella]MDF0530510.1 MFS transporter [Tsukamurella sp. 8J]MDF0586840.1 MFS transporter [Tsukamurella sp. 8F]
MTETSAHPPSRSSGAETRRAIWNTLRGSSGNLVEWYDVYVYTAFATYFEGQFFDKADKNSTIYVYAIFAVTFLTRPLGSWFFGRYADRHGRRAALTFSVTLMAACSMIIAVAPTREAVGVAAPLILIVCRLVQGFATGGEYGTSATYMSEAATRERRGFFSSFQYVTLVGGQVLAQLVLLVILNVMPEDDVRTYGWRVAFGIGGVAAVVVFWLRRSMDESLSAEQLTAIRAGRDQVSGSVRELFVNYWRPLLLVFFITMGGTCAFYVYSVNAPAMVKATYKDAPTTATWINLCALIVFMLLQPVGGIMSDRFGRRPQLIAFGVGALFYTYVLVHFIPQVHTALLSFLMLVVSYVLVTGYTSISALVKAEVFPSHIRALGVGIGYALANSIFGGTAPLIYEWAKSAGHVDWFIAYVTLTIAGSLITYIFFLRNKAETHLDNERGHAYA